MKKVFAILALALFIGGISVPVIAANNYAQTVIALSEEDPKKADSEKKTETTTTTKSSDCTKTEKSDSGCSKKCEDKKS